MYIRRPPILHIRRPPFSLSHSAHQHRLFIANTWKHQHSGHHPSSSPALRWWRECSHLFKIHHFAHSHRRWPKASTFPPSLASALKLSPFSRSRFRPQGISSKFFFRKLAIKSVLFLPIRKISQYLHVLPAICDDGFSRCALAMLWNQLNYITTVQVHGLIGFEMLPPSPWNPLADRASMDRKSRILIVSFFNYI